MVTSTRPPEIDWSTFPESDGEPMAETTANAIQMVDLQWALQTLFAIQGRDARTAVGGNQLMYYNERDGREHVAPDVYVIFDRRPPPPPSWKTWVEGGFPDIVFEITSPSTHAEDVGVGPKGKRRLYAALRVREYYIYDPQQETTPSFEGFELRAGQLEPLPTLSDGGIYSPLLRTELRPIARGETKRRPAGTWLRVLDPRTGEPIPIAEEERDDLQAVRGELSATQGQLSATQGQLSALREELDAEREQAAVLREQVSVVQGQLSEEARARAAAEERVARVEAALAELRAALEHRQEPGVSS